MVFGPELLRTPLACPPGACRSKAFVGGFLRFSYSRKKWLTFRAFRVHQKALGRREHCVQVCDRIWAAVDTTRVVNLAPQESQA